MSYLNAGRKCKHRTCTRNAQAKGFCGMHYMRFKAGTNMDKAPSIRHFKKKSRKQTSNMTDNITKVSGLGVGKSVFTKPGSLPIDVVPVEAKDAITINEEFGGDESLIISLSMNELRVLSHVANVTGVTSEHLVQGAVKAWLKRLRDVL